MKYCDSCRSSYPMDFATCPKDQSALRSITDLMPGLVLRGKYEILARVGSGGMGAVYKARHIAFGELRAIKLIGSHLAGDEDFLARFRGEAILARKLQHPNVVRVEDLDTTEDGRPIIVMEYVEGVSLRHALDQQRVLEPAQAVDIGRQVCAALSAAHALGILHRDVKPENMVLVRRPDGSSVVKVLDFGLAKVIEGFEGAGQQVSTRTGLVVGTPQYISPEQAMPSRRLELDGRLDLYSLGIVLYELLTGHLPFHADTPVGMVLEHVQTRPQPPHLLHPELAIPETLSALVLKALEKEPNQRFAGADEMGAALAAVAETLGPVPALDLASLTGAANPAFGKDSKRTAKAPTPPTLVVARDAVTKIAARPGPTGKPPAKAAEGPAARPDTGPLLRPRPGSRPSDGTAQGRRTPRPQPLAMETVETSGYGSLWRYAAVVALGGALWWGLRDPATPPPRESPPTTEAPAPAEPESAEGDPVPALPADAVAQNEVQQLILGSEVLRDCEVEVTVANGIVTLTGRAPSKIASELAGSLASSVAGVKRVFNLVKIAPPVTTAVAEATPPADGGPSVTAPPAERRAPTPAPPPPAPPERPNEAQVHQLLEKARRQIESGDHEGGAKTMEDVLRLDPGNPVAKEALERFRSHPPPPRPPR